MKKYNLTDSELQQLANLCKQEQGSITGARAEASLMCNLLETHSSYRNRYGDDVVAFCKRSGWFSKAEYYMTNGDAGNSYVEAVRDVMCNGNRFFPLGIDEHDCFSDITSATNNGSEINKRDRSAYIQNVTRIKNRYGSEYTFYCFPTSSSDPFGYTDNNAKYMTETTNMITVLSVLSLARSWIGKNEGDGSHKEIINIYNGHTPLARGYKVQYTDAWCATFVSAVFIKLGMYDFLECGCPEMIDKFKGMGRYYSASHTPSAGDIIFYDWNGDGVSDHVGIVENIIGETLTVIEGNKNDSVSRRSIGIHDGSICGYGVPNYSNESQTETAETYSVKLAKVWMGCPKSQSVLLLQEILKSRKYYNGALDWDFGTQTDKALRWYQDDRIGQGAKIGGADGKADGVCGSGTWTDLFGIKVN